MKVSQETFDAAVKENVDEFDMEAEEALQSAIEEFELQGVDLSGIIKSTTATDTSQHPVALAVAATQQALETHTADSAAAAPSPEGGAPVPAPLLAALEQLRRSLSADGASLPETMAVARASGAVPLCLAACESAAEEPGLLRAALRTLAAALQSHENRDAFLAADGAAKLCAALERHPQGSPGGSPALLEAAARSAVAAATQNEDNKCALVDSGLASRLIAGLKACNQAPEDVEPGSEAAIRAVCAVLRSLCLADDERPLDVPGGRVPGGRSFQNARTMAGEGAAGALLQLLLRRGHSSPALEAALCSAMRHVAVNDDICKEIADGGGVAAVLGVLQRHMGAPPVARAAAGLLRQLANNDDNKNAIVSGGGLELICTLVATHPTDAGALEQGLGLLVGITLRNPANAERAVEDGCVDSVIEVLGSIDDLAPAGEAAWVQRQACMSIRNIAARSPELRPIIMAKGAEPLLRAAKKRHPDTCQDVGSAALRDLDCEKYND